jgi:hypothetical protein
MGNKRGDNTEGAQKIRFWNRPNSCNTFEFKTLSYERFAFGKHF